MLRTANKQLKNISYQLSTVISDGEYHVKVMAKYPEELEVIEETNMYCKIECKGLLSPAKFNFVYRNKGDCTVYTSLKYSLPNKTNCDNTFKKPKKFLLTPLDKGKTFTNEFIYLCFNSKHGVGLQILVDFPDIADEAVSPRTKQINNEEQIK